MLLGHDSVVSDKLQYSVHDIRELDSKFLVPPEDPEEPTIGPLYRQQPKWVKSAFGNSVIISLNQAGDGTVYIK